MPMSIMSGRLIAALVSHISLRSLGGLLARASARQRHPVLDLRRDDVAVAEVTQAAGSDELALEDPRHLREPIVLQPNLDWQSADGIVVVDGDERGLATAGAIQDRLARNQE